MWAAPPRGGTAWACAMCGFDSHRRASRLRAALALTLLLAGHTAVAAERDAWLPSFTATPASPDAPHLAQVRVNDARSGTSQLYQLALDENGQLARRVLSTAPRPCSDCHGSDSPQQAVFHLSEAADGSVSWSHFLRDEELPRRAQVMRARLCEP